MKAAEVLKETDQLGGESGLQKMTDLFSNILSQGVDGQCPAGNQKDSTAAQEERQGQMYSHCSKVVVKVR